MQKSTDIGSDKTMLPNPLSVGRILTAHCSPARADGFFSNGHTCTGHSGAGCATGTPRLIATADAEQSPDHYSPNHAAQT